MLNVRQAFVRLTNIKEKSSVNFIAKPDNKNYKVHLSSEQIAPLFNNHSGEYTLELVIGDHHIENPFVWNLARLQFTFAGTPSQVRQKRGQVSRC
jgi:hypothetical protein